MKSSRAESGAGQGAQARQVVLLGCGFVADLYMRSLAAMPSITVAGVWDQDADRLRAFCDFWGLPIRASLADLLDRAPGRWS